MKNTLVIQQIKNQFLRILTFTFLTIIILLNNATGQVVNSTDFFRSVLYCNTPILEGEDLILSAIGGTSWSWTGPNNFTSNSDFNIISNADVSDTGIYYLTITDTIFDTITYHSINVSIDPPPGVIIIKTQPRVCTDSYLYLDNIYNNTPNYIFSWSSLPSNGVTFLPNSNSPNPIVVFSNVGTYQVTLIVKDAILQTVIATETISIEALFCCNGNTNSTLLDNTTLTNFLSTGFPIEDVIVINGLVGLDQNFIIPSNVTDIICLENAQIRLLDGYYLNVYNTTIKGCEKMWQSINVNDNSTLLMENCTIKDAQFAIYALPLDSKIILTNCDFYNNNYGIATWFSNPTLELSENLFAIQGNGMKPPMLNQKPKAGIISIGNPLLSLIFINVPNSFDGILNGIVAINSNLAAYSNFGTFSNMNETGLLGFDGSGITNLYDNNLPGPDNYFILKEGNTAPTATFDFENCRIGIWGQRVNLEIKNNLMNQVTTGILADQCYERTVMLDKNIINTPYEGIFLSQCDPVGQIDVTENTITLSPPADDPYVSACIKVHESGLWAEGIENIYKNNLTVNAGGKYGIYSNNAIVSIISENTIELNDALSNRAGIKLITGRGNEVRCNSVTGDDFQTGNSNTHEPFGIQVVSSTTVTYSCNETHNTYTGIGFEEICTGSDIRGNKMYDHTTGLYYNANANTGPQEYKGNKWLGTSVPLYPGTAALHIGNTSLSRYHVRPPCQYCMPPSLTPLWFFWNPRQGNSFDCELMSPPCEGGGSYNMVSGDTLITELDQAIALDSLLYESYETELNWSSDRYLYQKITEYPYLTQEDTLMQSFYTENINTTVGNYQDIENQFSTIYFQTKPIANILDSLVKLQINIADSIFNIRSLLVNSQNLEDSNFYISILAGLKASFSSLSALISITNQSLDTLRKEEFENLSTGIDQLPALTLPEMNEKTIRDITAEFKSNGFSSLTESQKNTIYSIAIQCPLSGGKAVYLARGLFSRIVDSLFNDQELCIAQGYVKSSPVQKDLITFSFYPNPTTEHLTIIWNEPLNTIVEFTLFDGLGRKIKQLSEHLKTANTRIDLEGMPSGVYSVQARYLDRVINLGKFVHNKQ